MSERGASADAVLAVNQASAAELSLDLFDSGGEFMQRIPMTAAVEMVSLGAAYPIGRIMLRRRIWDGREWVTPTLRGR